MGRWPRLSISLLCLIPVPYFFIYMFMLPLSSRTYQSDVQQFKSKILYNPYKAGLRRAAQNNGLKSLSGNIKMGIKWNERIILG